ncbi:hypothetical protein [Nostoc sp.]|uniref:hypothetical protein n=1 Tax=Nostoc sp. TaxID=1180 RepID=UPI002FFBE768
MRSLNKQMRSLNKQMRSPNKQMRSLIDYLLNPKNPTPPKLRFVSPPRLRGGIKGWGAMTVGIITILIMRTSYNPTVLWYITHEKKGGSY